MFDLWRVGSFLNENWIARSFNAQVPPGATLLSGHEASWRTGEWFHDDLLSRCLLADICATLGVVRLGGTNAGTEDLRGHIRTALGDGRLVAYRVHRATSAGAPVQRSGPAPEPAAPAQSKDKPLTGWDAPPAEETPTSEREAQQRADPTWIEIQLIGEDGKGIPGERYRITLPNGSVRQGVLDGQGLARVEGIDPGQCEVTFPALDEDAWGPAELA